MALRMSFPGSQAMSTLLRSTSAAALVLVLVLVIGTGCQKREPTAEVVSLQNAKIEKIERSSENTGTITVTFYNDKQDREVRGVGLVTADTEIMINGVLATLKDLREGERVNGEVRVERNGDERKQTAVKIYVERAKPAPMNEG